MVIRQPRKKWIHHEAYEGEDILTAGAHYNFEIRIAKFEFFLLRALNASAGGWCVL
jgi:hypothetical protein